MKGGLILEHVKPKDYTHERLYGSADRTEKIVPLGRDVSAVPQIYQGDKPFCVAATITWIAVHVRTTWHEYQPIADRITAQVRIFARLSPRRFRGKSDVPSLVIAGFKIAIRALQTSAWLIHLTL